MSIDKEEEIKILTRYDSEYYTPATRQAHRMAVEALREQEERQRTGVGGFVMERMTEKHFGRESHYMKCSETCANDGEMCGGCPELEKLVERLAAYEDTELTPRQIKDADDFLKENYQLRVDSLINAYGLLKAEKEGRLVVLPCKAGDVLWTFTTYPCKSVYSFCVTDMAWLNGIGTINTDRMGVIPYDSIGKTVFLTHEEAEEALMREKDGD